MCQKQTKTTKGNKQMKMTEKEIKEKRTKLVETLLEIEKQQDKKKDLERLLADDFVSNHGAYERGIVTTKGVLFRKPSYKCSAKPPVEV